MRKKIRSIVDFLGLGRQPSRQKAPPHAPSRSETETIRKIVARLERMPAEEARYIAAFAYILSRVARADMEISKHESRAMERLVRKEGGLPEDQAILVVQMAKTQSTLFGGTENFLVTHEFSRMASREQKMSLLHCLFAVSGSDESISSVEDHEIRKIARELGLTHQEYIDIRLEHRKHLAVLKKPSSAKSKR